MDGPGGYAADIHNNEAVYLEVLGAGRFVSTGPGQLPALDLVHVAAKMVNSPGKHETGSGSVK